MKNLAWKPLITINFLFYRKESEHPAKHLLFVFHARKSHRFGTTRGWVNDDRIYIFGGTIPLLKISSFKTPLIHSIVVLKTVKLTDFVKKKYFDNHW